MKLDIVKNTKRNLVWGAINRLIVLISPFVLRTFIQITLGEQYLGLNSLFRSIITVLNLSELGFGAAMVYCMYKPVAENDTKTVNALLALYRKAYHIIGTVIFTLGILLIPFLKYIIKDGYSSDINITLIYVLCLVDTCISYYMYAYMSSLIVVYQRNDINSSTNIIITVGLTVSQILVLILTKNYILFCCVNPIFTAINNIRIAYITHKMFPQYHCKGTLTNEIKKDLKYRLSGVFISQLCQTTRNSLDSVCVSAFIGLAMTAMYNNYYYIIVGVKSITTLASDALLGGIGNHVVTRSQEKNYSELEYIDFLYMWISGWFTACILCLSQPFMELWMGKSMMLPYSVVVLFALYFYLCRTGDMRSLYVSTNGLWWEHRYRAIVETILNIILNIVLGKLFGVYGIILATIITILVINIIWGSSITFKYYFGKDKLFNYFGYHIKYLVITTFISVVTLWVCHFMVFSSLILVLIIRGLICTIVPNVIYYCIFSHNKYYETAKNMIFKRWR